LKQRVENLKAQTFKKFEVMEGVQKMLQEQKQRMANSEGMSKEEFLKGISELKSLKEKLLQEVNNKKKQ
jgi:hypothetical protein